MISELKREIELRVQWAELARAQGDVAAVGVHLRAAMRLTATLLKVERMYH